MLSALRRLAAAGAIDRRRGELALADLEALRIDRVPHRPLLARCWKLKDTLTPYDAAYVALAEMMDLALVTADARLARAPGIRCLVEVLG